MSYVCKDCTKKFGNIGKLTQHRWMYHPNSISRKLQCKRCGLVLNSISKLRSHQWDHKKEDGWVSVKEKKLLPAVKLTPGPVSSNGGSEMTVSQLLVKLREQAKFLNDSVAMIDGILTHYNQELKQ